MGAGAMGHMETSLFEQCGYSREAIQARLERNWYEMFEGPDKIYWENDEGLGYVMDTGNHDVRTEGMSYAMMIAVQYGRKDVFDKLWGWVMKYMFMTEGLHQGYFVWSVDPSGVPNADGPAPDGEEYFAMDLFLASARWGDGEGVYEYSRHVRSILHTCVHQGEDGEGYPMWNPENHLIKFIPETEWTDPSYHLPHFYEVFAERADEADRPFWAQAAKASREYLVTACHPQTGMNPEYSNYDGTPHVDERDHWHFYSDAYRTAGNIGLDCLWNGVVPDLCDANARLRLRGRRHAGGRDRAAPGRLHRRHRRRLARRDALAGTGRARQRDPLGAPAVGHPDPHRHAPLLRQLPLRLRVPGVGGGIPHLVRCRQT